MKQVVVVEGPDGAGKSTFIESFQLFMGVKAYHGGGPPKTAEELRYRLERLPMEHSLMDRWSAISEIIYTTAFDKEPLVPYSECLAALHKVKPVIIYCRPPVKVLMSNKIALDVKKEHKDELHCKRVKENLHTIISIYDDFMDELIASGFIVLKYSYTGVN